MPVSKAIMLVASAGAAIFGAGAYLTQRGMRDDPKQAATSYDSLGYLKASALPDAVDILPPPPAAGSDGMQADERIREAALRLDGTPRYALARSDAVRTAAGTAQGFACALGTDISAEHTPALFALLSRVRLDVRVASYPAKSHYKRPRPFVLHQTHSCYPDDEDMVREDGSYPSARGAVGWAYALVLVQVLPDRRDELLKRGLAFGESRVVCDQEWQSDVDAGRTLAAAAISRLQASEAFRADLARARNEVATAKAAGVKPRRNCSIEAAALAKGQARSAPPTGTAQ